MSILSNIQDRLRQFQNERQQEVAAVVVIGNDGGYCIIFSEDHWDTVCADAERKSLAAIMHAAGTDLLQYDRMEGRG